VLGQIHQRAIPVRVIDKPIEESGLKLSEASPAEL
jgi:hypothetical protein